MCIGQHLVDIPDEDDDIILKRKATTPLIRTVMTTVPPVDSEKFGIANWAEFQDMLKSNYFVISTGTIIRKENSWVSNLATKSSRPRRNL